HAGRGSGRDRLGHPAPLGHRDRRRRAHARGLGAGPGRRRVPPRLTRPPEPEPSEPEPSEPEPPSPEAPSPEPPGFGHRALSPSRGASPDPRPTGSAGEPDDGP